MNLRRARALALAGAACGAMAGCGGGTPPPAPSGGAVFARSCSSCHSLSGRYDPAKQGGDLLGFHSTRGQLLQFAAEMPVRHRLGRAELQAVVEYVMRVERAGR